MYATSHILETVLRILFMFYHTGSGTSILKEVMNLCIDIDLGPVRLPLIPALPAEQNQKLKAELQELEFFEWI